MSLDARSAPTPFDPEGGQLPQALDTLLHGDAAPPVLLVVAADGARSSGWSARATIALAGAVARERSVVLADLGVDRPELHQLLGVSNLEGLADVFLFGASLPRVAQAAPGQPFEVVAAGAYVPDAGDLMASSRWERIADEYRMGGATLLAYVPAGMAGLDGLASRMNAALVLADEHEVAAAAASLPDDANVLGVLTPAGAVQAAEPPAPEAAPVPQKPDITPRPPRTDADLLTPPVVRSRTGRRRGVSPLLIALLVIAAGVGGWFGYDAFFGGDAGAPTREPAPVEPAAQAQPEPAPTRGSPIETELGVSVSVAIYQSYEMARDRITDLRRSGGIGFYLTPFDRGGVRYYRLQAGPVADPTEGRALLRRLYEAGQVTAMEDHAIRPTAWAYELGEYDTEQAARARQEALAGMGVPGYVVEVPYTSGPSRWRVYGGAYEYRAEAEAMADILAAAGIDAELVQRTGRPTA